MLLSGFEGKIEIPRTKAFLSYCCLCMPLGLHRIPKFAVARCLEHTGRQNFTFFHKTRCWAGF